MMKKDIEWLKEEIGDLPIADTVFISDCISYVDTAVSVMSVYDLIDQLDKSLLSTKELPVIPRYVDEYISLSKNNISLKQVLEKAIRRDEWTTWIKAYSWISANDEMFARAWLDGYKVAEEQKYYVDLDTAAYVAKWKDDDRVDIYTDGISGSDGFEFYLTEQEIKNYDERFWPFAKPVE